jgi:plasmid stabilization system protein ParE
MSYSVLWTPQAEQELAALWNAGPDRAAIAAAADELDVLLSRDPTALGESRIGSRRLLFHGALAALIDVRPGRVVHVLTVKRNSRRR